MKALIEIDHGDIGKCYKLCDVPRGIGYVIFKKDRKFKDITSSNIEMLDCLKYKDIFFIIEIRYLFGSKNTAIKILKNDIIGWIYPKFDDDKSSIEEI